MHNIETLFSSKSDEWATPEDLFQKLDEEFGFDLDPCSTEENHKCEKYYTAEDDGLSKNWGGGECSAIRHIATSLDGLPSATTKERRKTLSWFCSYRPEPTQNTFMITSYTGQRFAS